MEASRNGCRTPVFLLRSKSVRAAMAKKPWRNSMRNLLIIVLVVLGGTQAFARLETQCWFNNCLSDGWSTTEWGSFYRAETSCANKDCGHAGWITNTNAGVNIEIRCKAQGCFTEGWQEVRYFPRYTESWDIQCIGSDCNKNGWSARSQSGNNWADVRCIQGDCRIWGWETRTSGGHGARTTCSWNDCFKYGCQTDPW